MRWTSGWTWLAITCVAAGTRWWLMFSSRPFRAVLPAPWFQGEAYGLTRLGANALCSALLLGAFPLAMLALSRRGELVRAAWLGKPEGISIPWMAALAALAAAGGFATGLLVPAVDEAYPVWRSAGHGAGHLLLSASLVTTVILSTEVLYRGVALARMADAWGTRAVYAILPIYVLDHVGAPIVEVVASAATGIALSHLALRTRSIWPGFGVHAAFALSVDLGSITAGASGIVVK